MRVEIRSQTDGPSKLFLMPVKPVEHGDVKIERDADGNVVHVPGDLQRTALPRLTPILSEPPCVKFAETVPATDPVRIVSEMGDPFARLSEMRCSYDEWRDLSWLTGLVHVRNHERRVDRYSFLSPRTLVHTLCGIQDRVMQGAFQFVELVMVLDPRLWGRDDALCVECAWRVRRRGQGFTFEGLGMIEREPT